MCIAGCTHGGRVADVPVRLGAPRARAAHTAPPRQVREAPPAARHLPLQRHAPRARSAAGGARGAVQHAPAAVPLPPARAPRAARRARHAAAAARLPLGLTPSCSAHSPTRCY